MKIGNSNHDFIKSKSGIYHLGVMYQGALETSSKIQIVPVLVVDSLVAGIYDTVIPDLSTCLLYTSPSPRDRTRSRMPSSA